MVTCESCERREAKVFMMLQLLCVPCARHLSILDLIKKVGAA